MALMVKLKANIILLLLQIQLEQNLPNSMLKLCVISTLIRLLPYQSEEFTDDDKVTRNNEIGSKLVCNFVLEGYENDDSVQYTMHCVTALFLCFLHHVCCPCFFPWLDVFKARRFLCFVVLVFII